MVPNPIESNWYKQDASLLHTQNTVHRVCPHRVRRRQNGHMESHRCTDGASQKHPPILYKCHKRSLTALLRFRHTHTLQPNTPSRSLPPPSHTHATTLILSQASDHDREMSCIPQRITRHVIQQLTAPNPTESNRIQSVHTTRRRVVGVHTGCGGGESWTH